MKMCKACGVNIHPKNKELTCSACGHGICEDCYKWVNHELSRLCPICLKEMKVESNIVKFRVGEIVEGIDRTQYMVLEVHPEGIFTVKALSGRYCGEIGRYLKGALKKVN